MCSDVSQKHATFGILCLWLSAIGRISTGCDAKVFCSRESLIHNNLIDQGVNLTTRYDDEKFVEQEGMQHKDSPEHSEDLKGASSFAECLSERVSSPKGDGQAQILLAGLIASSHIRSTMILGRTSLNGSCLMAR